MLLEVRVDLSLLEERIRFRHWSVAAHWPIWVRAHAFGTEAHPIGSFLLLDYSLNSSHWVSFMKREQIDFEYELLADGNLRVF